MTKAVSQSHFIQRHWNLNFTLFLFLIFHPFKNIQTVLSFRAVSWGRFGPHNLVCWPYANMACLLSWDQIYCWLSVVSGSILRSFSLSFGCLKTCPAMLKKILPEKITGISSVASRKTEKMTWFCTYCAFLNYKLRKLPFLFYISGNICKNQSIRWLWSFIFVSFWNLGGCKLNYPGTFQSDRVNLLQLIWL